MSPSNAFPHIAIVGAGAVGSLVGGKLLEAGCDVTLIDAWPEHVNAMQAHGLTLEEHGSVKKLPVRALHIGQVASLHRHPVDIAFICVKLYDTDWASALISPYLSCPGYVVTLQNGLIEEVVAARVGWPRTVGCIGSGLHVGLAGPGHVRRSRADARSSSPAFYVGEAHGLVTPRVKLLVELLDRVDTTAATTNLWGLRWAKLVANCMTSALCGVTGHDQKNLFGTPECIQVMIHLAAEAITLGQSRGYAVEPVFGLPAESWLAATLGEQAAISQVQSVFRKQYELVNPTSQSGTAQDIQKGRRTEVDYMNGYIATQAKIAGIAAPHHQILADLVKCIEAGTAHPDAANLSHFNKTREIT